MSEQIERISPRDRRITKHIRTIADAGTDIEKFAEALRGVRDDPALTSAHRDAIYKTLAQEASQAYFVFATGQEMDLEALLGSPEEG